MDKQNTVSIKRKKREELQSKLKDRQTLNSAKVTKVPNSITKDR